MDEKGFENINVIPLVDVMLVLLTIVLTTSTFIAMGAIPLQLPRAENSDAPMQRCITIEIDSHGQLFMDGEQLSLSIMEERLAAKNKSLPISVRADRRTMLQNFVGVMDMVKAQGFKSVSLQTEVAQ
jgi:biopolymer transport protein ExbD